MEPYYKNANNSKLFSDINVEIEESNVVVNPEFERHTIQDISSERFQKRGTRASIRRRGIGMEKLGADETELLQALDLTK